MHRPAIPGAFWLLSTLALPRINDLMVDAQVTAIHATVGDSLAPGAKLMDLRVDLSAVAPHDCPPVSHFRLVLHQHAFLRRLAVVEGDIVAVGDPLASFSTTANETLDGDDSFPARITIAGILAETDGW
jgi:pyruvate/2-oxoglutarate dehydrogenase complex dihydrolipoamide acyltransferase (E2) component